MTSRASKVATRSVVTILARPFKAGTKTTLAMASRQRRNVKNFELQCSFGRYATANLNYSGTRALKGRAKISSTRRVDCKKRLD